MLKDKNMKYLKWIRKTFILQEAITLHQPSAICHSELEIYCNYIDFPLGFSADKCNLWMC